MNTTPGSSQTSSENEKRTAPKVPVETDKEIAFRQAETRLADWNSAHGLAGVRKAFAGATLKDYTKEDAETWRNGIRAGSWIYLHGQVGTGKTHLLSALVRSRFIWGWTCWFVYVPEFLARMKKSYDKQSMELSADLTYRAENCEFLAFDDIGTEKLSAWSSDLLTTIVNARYASKLATGFSSNFNIDELAGRYERLADRIRERALVVPLEERRPERG